MSPQVDDILLQNLVGTVVGDVAGAMGLLMAYIGDQAGVYRAMVDADPMTADELAEKIGLNPKYLHEWLGANAAAGYVTHHPDHDRFSLSPEQALVFAAEGHPACLQGFFQAVVAQFETNKEAVDTFVSGKGRPWGDHSQCLFCGTDRFFRPGYAANLIASWIPALDGVQEKLATGAKVADIGCGHGSSTILMAEAYPQSRFYGIDFHEPSIEEAKRKAAAAGLRNVEFLVGRAQDYPGDRFDFACIFDALHDMGDPVGAARHVRETLGPDGTFMLVEPRAGDTMAENMHPLGQIFYGFSTTVCTPASLAQHEDRSRLWPAGYSRISRKAFSIMSRPADGAKGKDRRKVAGETEASSSLARPTHDAARSLWPDIWVATAAMTAMCLCAPGDRAARSPRSAARARSPCSRALTDRTASIA